MTAALAMTNQGGALSYNLRDLFQLAEALMHAPGFIPKHFRHPGEVVAAILTGRELGIPAMASLRGISFVEGKVVLDQALHLGCMIARGVKYRWLSDGLDGEAQLWLQRPGQEPFVSVFTLEMARNAGLLSKGTWQKYPAAMLRARAVSAASRAYMPDVLSGCYVPGELPGDRREHEPPSESMQAADFSATQQVGAGVPSASALPAQTESSAPLELPARIVRDLYAVQSRAELKKLNDEAGASWSAFRADEREAINQAGKWAKKHLEEVAREAEERRKEAEEAERALAAQQREPGASDQPDAHDATDALDEARRAHEDQLRQDGDTLGMPESEAQGGY